MIHIEYIVPFMIMHACMMLILSSPSSYSKLGPKDQGDKAFGGALHSLSELDLDYIDLYLIHWPGTQGLVVDDKRNPGKVGTKSLFTYMYQIITGWITGFSTI